MVAFDEDYNLLAFVLLIAGFVGCLWLAFNKVDAGFIYALMFLGSVGAIFLVMFFSRDEERDLPRLTGVVRIPVAKSLRVAGLAWLVGLVVPFFVQGFFWFLNLLVGGSFSVTSFSIPLLGNSLLGGFAQSFSSAEIQSNISWLVFTSMFSAGIIEEFVFDLGSVFVGVFVGLLIWKSFGSGVRGRNVFALVVGFLFSMLLFVGAHLLNGTYGGFMFLVAGVFKLGTLLAIFVFGLPFLAVVGYHMSNNLIWLMEQRGVLSVLGGFVSWFGIMFLLLVLIAVVAVVRGGGRNGSR